MSAVEAVMVDAACCQLGKWFGLPVHAYLGLSDAKCPDMQAGFETTLGVMMAALAGVNIASGAGMLDYVNCHSLEKLVMDGEICAHAQRLAAGIRRREGTGDLDAIRECAEKSSFLTSEHTRQHFRQEVHHPDRVIDRLSQSDWEAAGSPSAARRAHEAVAGILDAPPEGLPPGETLSELESLMQRDALAAGAESLPDWSV
jgi:trimethylamine--corrinoid protein Co-methyltransferase